MTDFDDDLASAFKEKICEDDEFAKHVYAAMSNIIWKHDDGREFAVTFRVSGGIIAEIRESGDYMDWYCSSPEGVVTLEIADRMKEMGWTWHEYD